MQQPPPHFLTDQQERTIRGLHRVENERRIADRLKTILLLNKGFSFSEISELLLLDEMTIRTSYRIYVEEGIKSLVRYNYTGGLSYLSSDQLADLSNHLQSKMYRHSKDIRAYIEQTYSIEYTLEGVRHLLKRQGFVYKKTKHLPGKGNLKLQKEFVEYYRKLKADKAQGDSIYFMDGVHPLHNSMTCNGWIKKGTEKSIQANTGRDRMNINGVCNIENATVLIHEDVSINAQSTIALLDKLQQHQPNGKINIIADNAKYYRSKLVAHYLEMNKRICIIFLPPYSPNLNLIERLWKFYKKEILYDSYYEKFNEFKNATFSFFHNLENRKEELISLLKDNFYFPIQKFSKT